MKQDGSELNDTMRLKFNLIKYKGTSRETRKVFYRPNDKININTVEYVGLNDRVHSPEYIKGSLKVISKGLSTGEDIPSDITISLLIDRSGSINEEEMDKIKNAVKAFVESVPEGCLYFSWFHDDISSSIPLSKENFEQEADFSTSDKNTALYNAIYTKLLEFDKDSSLPNPDFEPELKKNFEIADRNSVMNYLIVLTDGVNDVENIQKYSDDGFDEVSHPRLRLALNRYKNKVKVYTLGFGKDSEAFDEEELREISRLSGNPNGYFLAKPDSILQLLKVTIAGELTPDYELKLLNPKGKTYRGKIRNLRVEIINEDVQPSRAVGSVPYFKGSATNPVTVGRNPFWGNIMKGLIAGIVFLLVIMIIIQLLIPLLKNKIFNSKYVKKYKPADNEIRKECPYCGDPLNVGEHVVEKCQHIVHKACWADFDYVCPEYGQNCNDGKQNYFDLSDPFSRKNKIYYLNWVFFGLIGGFITWIFYMVLKDTGIVKGFAENTLFMIKPHIRESEFIELAGIQISSANYIESFIDKISSIILIGILMGFFLTSFFAYIEEFRRKSWIVIGRILLRGLVGSLTGFIAFYLGSIALILLNQPQTNIAFDWIPWIIFGSGLGIVLSVKTTIHWKHGLLGGLISIIFSFLVLYFIGPDLGDNAVLTLSFMIYGAGLGFSIATVRTAAEQYFLKIIEGKKHEETIPVHKWMSYQGGHNEVYVGTGLSCEIQMNWEKDNPEIADRHAKMFINTSRNIPVIVSLDKEKLTTYDERLEMEPGKEYDLMSGNTFRIGKTVFQYYEKDK